MKSLKKNSIFNISYTLLSLIFPLVSSMYAARVLAPESIGKVAFAANYASYFTALASLGIPNYGIREIAKRKEDRLEASKFFSELLVINFITTTFSLIIFMITIFSVGRFAEDVNLYIACGFLIFLNYFNVDWLYQGEEEYGYIVIRSFATKVIAFAALLLFVKSKDDYIIYTWISGVAVAGNSILNVIHSRKIVKFHLNGLHIAPHFMPVMIIAVGVLLSTIYGKIDILMLGILSDEIHTGFYSYGYKLINIIVTICTALTTVFMPRLSYLYSEDKEKFNSLMNWGVELLMFITIPMFLAVILLADDIAITLFGDEFIAASATIKVLSPLILIKGIGNLLAFQVIMCTGNEKERLPATVMGSGVNVILNYFIIPCFFEVGAAIASVVSEIIVNGYQIYKISKVVDIKIKRKNVIHSIIISIIMGVAIYFVTIIIHSHLISCIVSFLIGTSLYIGLNLMVRDEMANELVNSALNLLIRKR